MLGLVLDAQMMLSIAMIALSVLAVFQWKDNRPVFRQKLKENWKEYWRSKRYWSLMVFFFIVAMTVPYSTESGQYMHNRLMVKLPFLLLPFAFFSVPNWTKKEIQCLFYAFVGLLVFGSLKVLVEYSLNFEYATAAVGRGDTITHEVNHIRYSLMVVVGLMLLIYLYRKQFVWKYPWERWVQIGVGVFLLVFLHILAARSGLILFYLLISFYLVEYIYTSGKYMLGLVIFFFLMSLPFLSYQTIPSFKNKIDYVVWDFQEFQKGKTEGYSDGQRWLSWQIGWEIAKENPILGIGAGDLKKEVWGYYETHHPLMKPNLYKMPHNQFLTVWAGSGILGLCLFLWAYFLGFWQKKTTSFKLYFLFKAMLFLSFIVENTIENAIGIALFLLFEILFLKYIELD